MYCTECGYVSRDVYTDGLQRTMYCTECNANTMYSALCNGGIKTRVRINDWPLDPEFYRGQYQAESLTCKDSDGADVKRYHSETGKSGLAMHSKPRYHNGTDEREERREVKKYATRRKRGRLPLTFDQKGQ